MKIRINFKTNYWTHLEFYQWYHTYGRIRNFVYTGYTYSRMYYQCIFLMRPIGRISHRGPCFDILRIKDMKDISKIWHIKINCRNYFTIEFAMIWKIILTGLRHELVPYVALVERIGKVDNGPDRQGHLHDRNWFFGRSMKHHQTLLWNERNEKLFLLQLLLINLMILFINSRIKYLPVLN